jgi:hypothetical protein
MMARRILLACTLVVAFLQFWHTRFHMYSDGISYLDVARSLEVSSYWSPLFSWLLAPVVRLVPLAWTATAVHALQTLFAVVAVLLADRLWRLLSPATAEDRGWMMTRWMAAWWAVFSLANVGLVQPDLLTACLYLAACIFVLERRPVALGLILAAGYLAKAAMLPFAAFLLGCWFFVDRRRTLLATGVLLVCCLPWWLALRQHTGRWTIGDSGPLNYAWEVNGVTRWMHGQGGPRSTRQISTTPEAFVYPAPFQATYPPWYEPSYWFQGLEKTPFSLANQLRALQENGAPALWYWISTPGLLAAVALGTRFRDWRGLGGELRLRWLLLVPALATVAMYVAVFFETRYVVPQFFLLGTIPLHAAYVRCGPPAGRLFPIAAAAALFFTLAAELGVSAKSLLWDGNTPNPYAQVAAELQAAGASPGTPVAFVGLTLQPEWARQAQLRIVGDVPFRYDRDPGLHRYINFDRTNLEEFWQAPAAVRSRIYRNFAQAGARYVVAHEVPADGDTAGWTRLSTKIPLLSGQTQLWIRPLTPLEGLPATSAWDSDGPVPGAARGNAAPKNRQGPG